MKYRHKPRSKLGAVIFDLDGTLVDSAADIASSLNHALSCGGLATVPLANVRTVIGDGVAALVRKTIDHQGATVDPDRCNRVTERFMTFAHSVPVNASTLYPGAKTCCEGCGATESGWASAPTSRMISPDASCRCLGRLRLSMVG